MLPFAIGTTSLVFPQVGVPLLGVSAAWQGIQALRKGRKEPAAQAQVWNDLALLSTGDIPPVFLSWDNITCVLEDKKHKTSKMLLQGISGTARPGRLVAIMGPSGSGKTTLLNSLASQLGTNKHITLTGKLTVNGVPATEANHRQAYVQQEDVFYSQLTVVETLTMAAELRLPPTMSTDEKRAYVERLMKVLGLSKVANSRVGDKKRRGLSGGEKKRLSLACELVGSPSLVFLDEPTSGLDAAAAEKVMATLKALAGAGHTVVTSIHQPRSSIWEMFDDLILLHEGQLVYQGPADQALPHFAALGYVCPPAHNPAEFLADLISADYSAPEMGGPDVGVDTGNNNSDSATAQARVRVQQLVQVWRDHPHPQSPGKRPTDDASHEDAAVHVGAGVPAAPLLPCNKQLGLLARRSWKQVVRDKAATISRIGANVSSALVFGIIFWRMGRSQSSIQDRMGLMQVVAINTAMSSLSKTLNVFPRERLIVNRERARHAYHTAPYLLGKLAAELPVSAIFPLLFGCLVYPLCGLNPKPARFTNFLGIVTLASFASSAFGLMVGSFAPSTESAMAIGPALMTVWIVFGGYYVNAENVPWALRWLPKASLIKQAFAALTINEMAGSNFEPDANGRGMTTGEDVLQWLSFGNTTVKSACLQQLRITAFYYVAAYSILQANKPRFQPLLPSRTSTKQTLTPSQPSSPVPQPAASKAAALLSQVAPEPAPVQMQALPDPAASDSATTE